MKHLKRFLAGGVSLLTMLCAACGANNAAPAGPDQIQPFGDLDQILQRGAINVCSTGDYPPFTYLDSQGEWSGIDVDLAQDLSQRLGVELNLVPTTWATMMEDLSAKCDMAMGGITITLDRAKSALYSNPVVRDGKAAITRCEDASRYTDLADIDRPGVRVVVNPGGSNADFDHEHIKQAQIVEYPDNKTIFEQLENDHADVMITDVSEIRWQTQSIPDLCAVSIDNPFTFSQKAYLISRKGPALQQWVNQWLTIVQNDGTFARINEKWGGSVSPP
jgi:cyclohexadienyl dehydratase